MGPRIIVALDFQTDKEALAFVQRLDPRLCRLKVATTLFTRYGPAIVESLQKLGFELFLDLKFFDIPHQVAGACKMAADLGVWMVDCHAAGGRRMLSAAKEAMANVSKPPLFIAVTVLTSFDDAELSSVGVSVPLVDQVTQLAELAAESGCDGVVCSAAELPLLRALPKLPADFITVTPGIRFEEDARDDQRRVLTPSEAFAASATYLVMGRSVTRCSDPNAALQRAQPQE